MNIELKKETVKLRELEMGDCFKDDDCYYIITDCQTGPFSSEIGCANLKTGYMVARSAEYEVTPVNAKVVIE